MYVLSRTVAQGTRGGLASAAGVSTGALVHVAAAYLGVQALRAKGSALQTSERNIAVVKPWQAFRQGVLVDVLNPKVAIFFMAFLPQFVRPGHGSASLQLLQLGVLVIVVAVAVDSTFVCVAARTTEYLRRRPRASVWLDSLLGSLFIGLGIRLAFSEQRSLAQPTQTLKDFGERAAVAFCINLLGGVK